MEKSWKILLKKSGHPGDRLRLRQSAVEIFIVMKQYKFQPLKFK